MKNQKGSSPEEVSRNRRKIEGRKVKQEQERQFITQAQDQHEVLAKYLVRAKSYLREGKAEEAISVLEEAVGIDPLCAESYVVMGYCWEKLVCYERALSCYERAFELDPSRSDLHYNMGVTLQLLGLTDEAEKEYRKVLASNENHLMARNNLAAIYLKKGRRVEASEEFGKLVERDPSNPTFLSNFDRLARKTSSIFTKGKRVRKGISLCVVMREEGEEVREFFKLFSPGVDEIVVVDASKGCEGAEVAKEGGALVIPCPWEEDLSALRNSALQHAGCEWVLMLDTDEYMCRHSLSYLRTLISSEHYDGFRFIQRNYSDSPGTSGWVPCTDRAKWPWNCVGWIPSFPVKLFRNHEGILFEGVTGERIAESIVKRGRKLGRTSLLVHHVEDFSPPEKRIEKERIRLSLWEKQLALTPHDPQVCYELGVRYLRFHNHEEALRVLSRLVEIVPNSYFGYNELGNAWCARKEYQLAHDCYVQALRIEPRFFQAHFNLAYLHLKRGELDLAWEHYQKALTVYPLCAQIYGNLAVICEKKGEDEMAESLCEKALLLNPFLAHAYNNLGVLYSKRGESLKAKEYYEKALSLGGGCSDAYHNLGVWYLGEEKFSQAEEMFGYARRCAAMDIGIEGE